MDKKETSRRITAVSFFNLASAEGMSSEKKILKKGGCRTPFGIRHIMKKLLVVLACFYDLSIEKKRVQKMVT